MLSIVLLVAGLASLWVGTPVVLADTQQSLRCMAIPLLWDTSSKGSWNVDAKAIVFGCSSPIEVNWELSADGGFSDSGVVTKGNGVHRLTRNTWPLMDKANVTLRVWGIGFDYSVDSEFHQEWPTRISLEEAADGCGVDVKIWVDPDVEVYFNGALIDTFPFRGEYGEKHYDFPTDLERVHVRVKAFRNGRLVANYARTFTNRCYQPPVNPRLNLAAVGASCEVGPNNLIVNGHVEVEALPAAESSSVASALRVELTYFDPDGRVVGQKVLPLGPDNSFEDLFEGARAHIGGKIVAKVVNGSVIAEDEIQITKEMFATCLNGCKFLDVSGDAAGNTLVVVGAKDIAGSIVPIDAWRWSSNFDQGQGPTSPAQLPAVVKLPTEPGEYWWVQFAITIDNGATWESGPECRLGQEIEEEPEVHWEQEGQNYNAPWRISEDARFYESERVRQGGDVSGWAKNYYGPGSGKDPLPAYHDNGVDGGPSRCSLDGDCLEGKPEHVITTTLVVTDTAGITRTVEVTETVVFTDPLQAFDINFSVAAAPERNDVAKVMGQWEFEPVSKDGQIVAVVLVKHSKITEGPSDGSPGPYDMYRGLMVTPHTIVAYETLTIDVWPAQDVSTPGVTHSVVGIGWGTERAEHVFDANKCAGQDPSDCQIGEWLPSVVEAQKAGKAAWDGFWCRAVGSCDGAVYFGHDVVDADGTVHHRSVESLFAARGQAYPINDMLGNHEIPAWFSGWPEDKVVILPVLSGSSRGASMNVCTQILDNGDVVWNEACTDDVLSQFVREFPNNWVDLNPEDYRGPWGIPSPGDPDRLLVYGVSRDFYESIRGKPEELNKLADLVPAGKLHVVDVPFEHDVHGKAPMVEIEGGAGLYGVTLKNSNGFTITGELTVDFNDPISVTIPAESTWHLDRLPVVAMRAAGEHRAVFNWSGAGNDGQLDVSYRVCDAGNVRGHDLGFTCLVDNDDHPHPDTQWGTGEVEVAPVVTGR